MTDWRRIGQAVVCVDDQYAPPPPGWRAVGLVSGWHETSLVGATYVIREVKWSGGMALFRFVGYRWLNNRGDEMWEPDWRYRPVVDRKADISELTAILDRLPKREVLA